MAGVEINENIEEDSEKKDERIPVHFATQTKRLVCIEYPGYIKNISKALQTLGGEKEVATILRDPVRRVGLRMRPKDPYSKQAFADRFAVSDVLMKVTRRRKKGTEEFQYKCEILGVIDTNVKFKGLFDFQYLAPDVPDLLSELRGSEILETETPLHLPPAIFARVDHSFDYQYRPDAKSRSSVGEDQNVQHEMAIGTTTRKRRPNHALSCGFNALTTPDKPKEGALKEMKRYNDEGLAIVQHLFNIRPIWSRRAVVYHLDTKAIRVRLLLPCVAYYWTGGPWRTLWTKFGYDPRKNPAAKIYQKLDFRLRSKKALRGIKLPPTIRSIYDFSLHTGVQKTHPNTVIPLGITSPQDSDKPSTSHGGRTGDENEQGRESVENPEVLPYVFYPDRPPATRQVIYQLCDLHCVEAQKLISVNDGKETVCTLSEGWLLPGSNEKLRRVLTESLIKLLKKPKTGNQDTITELNDQLGDIEDEEASFLDTLMEDDDVEAYDLLDEDF